jgi:two-component system, OmpR family, sensor histidine kinase KdpD
VFLAAAGIASTVAEVARHRAEEAELRRREADLAAEMARSCSVARRCRTRCRPSGGASRRRSISPRRASSSPRWRPTRAASGCRSTSGAGGRGRSWCRPPSSRGARARQGADRAALEALLAAALDREALQSEGVETQALRRSDVIKTALLRAVSHDLRSPLTAIVTAGSALRSAGLDPAEREELAAVVTGEASRLARLVDKLLDLSRLQGGTAEPREDWYSIEEVVEAAVADLEGQDGPPVRLALDRDLPLVRADAAQRERAFSTCSRTRAATPATPPSRCAPA